MEDALTTIDNDLLMCGGQLKAYASPVDPTVLINPIQRWRRAVRNSINLREIEHFREEARHHPMLQILSAATADSWLRVQNLLQRSPHPINWIRIRLLCGTSSLNSMMTRITRGTRSCFSPMCGTTTDAVVHFLCECCSPECIASRECHSAFMQLSFQCAISSLTICFYSRV